MSNTEASNSLLACVNIFGGIIFSFNTGITAMSAAPLSRAMGFAKDSPGGGDFDYKLGLFTGAIVLGAAIGSIGGGLFSDWLGRKWTMVITGGVSFIGVVLCVVAPTYWPLVVFRLILGLGVGLTSVVCPVYVGEMAPKENRGFLNSLCQVSITIGIVFSYVFGFGLQKYNISDSFKWKSMLAIGALPAAELLIVCAFMPESKTWLANRSKRDADMTLSEDASLVNQGPSGGVWQGLWTPPVGSVAPAVIIGTVLGFALQLTGINAVIYYAPEVLEGSVKFGNLSDDDNKNLATILVGVWNCLSTLFALFLVDYTGRRPLMLTGLTLMTLGNIGLGIVFKWVQQKAARTALSIIGLLLFIGGFELGPGALFWVLLAEIFPNSARDIGNGYVNVFQWSLNLGLSIVFPIVKGSANQNLPWVFFFFGVMALASTLFMFFFVPETKGKNLADETGEKGAGESYTWS